MEIIESPNSLQQLMTTYRTQGLRIGFVPTMGALHKGHTSLMDLAQKYCDVLVVSIFVNPLQFADNEDLDSYPNTPDVDHALCKIHGVNVVFRPTVLYSCAHSTTVSISQLTTGLCGRSRPTHFDGVTTVVARLFGLVQPHVAVFGQKDYQQLAVLRQMVQDLAMPIQVIGGPIVREEDGLALSSRNAYLTPTERHRALSLSKSLYEIQKSVQTGEESVEVLTTIILDILDVDRLDYVEFVHPKTLQPVTKITEDTRLCIAAFLGNTRLIDNCALELSL
jgi:pantoate--beta-alanine ligase